MLRLWHGWASLVKWARNVGSRTRARLQKIRAAVVIILHHPRTSTIVLTSFVLLLVVALVVFKGDIAVGLGAKLVLSYYLRTFLGIGSASIPPPVENAGLPADPTEVDKTSPDVVPVSEVDDNEI